ncbi:YfhO family protein [Lactiplantibacillus pentosus]|uniref:YfhO family protein n=4 Tax=Lactiplantibacillus pentosus TaxID=1589 RepID=A0AAX6LCC2_LACPE|nr:YfhO family protein [Lactiplantibacillus pentosus]AYJ41652.1 hypothetical protein LP314_07000 [Lactiplantibacillus pentosus]KRK26335.1 integral membrane protein [Lactiplantibacillus pentosus DSM 20314]MCC3162720.1 YfhO family protein [Lactiplantibacillus pentosus]MCJ8186717.1 YfhO family protein [Lactiplantibacillus pentosus]MCT3300203.1 hypothetical protein [Lactiplantibacillus pentosus]
MGQPKMHNRQTSRWPVAILSGLLSMMIIGVVFGYYHITPFGNHNLLISDMGGQYLSFFTAYRHAILAHSFQAYSFSQSIGGNALPNIAYYLLSPFNLLILFFPAAHLPTALSLLIIVKIGAIGISMTWFLQTHFNTRHWSTAIFGTAFSCCGFVALNYFTVMWLDALIWLPLVIMGLDRLIATGHGGQFFGWFWLSIVTNYYLGYMTGLFVGYYFIYQLFETKPAGERIWQTIRTQSTLIWHFILTTLLCGLSTMFLLIPTGLGMLTTAKTAVKPSSYLPVLQISWKTLSQFGIGAANFTTRLAHAPTVFTSTLVLLLAGCFFVHPQLSRAHKWHGFGLLLALFLSMAIRTLDTIWHMFQTPAGFPYRNAFFFSFALIMMAFEAWQAGPRQVAPVWKWGLPIGLMVALIFGWWGQRGTHHPLATSTLLLSLAAVILTASCLFLTAKRWQVLGLTGITALELGLNSKLMMAHSPFGNQTKYVAAYRIEDRQMRSVSDPDGQLYRVESRNTLINQAYNASSHYRNYNDPLLFNFHDISYYSSTFANQTRLMLKSLGLFSKNARRVSSEGLNPVTDLLLAIKYDVQLNAVGQATINSRSQNGLGFAVPNAFTQVKLRQNSALVNQERILQSLQPSATAYFGQAVRLDDHVTYDATAPTFPYRHTIKLRVTRTGYLYYNDTLGQSKFTTMRVNGHLVPTKFNANGDIVLRSLGYFDKDSLVTLTVKRTRTSLGSHVHLASLDRAKFNSIKHRLRASRFVPTYHVAGLHTIVSGTVTATHQQRWCYIAIPADQGWAATVNGAKVRTRTVIGGMLAVPIHAGHNHIRLIYHVPGLKLGALISVLSGLSFLTWTIWDKRRLRDIAH